MEVDLEGGRNLYTYLKIYQLLKKERVEGWRDDSAAEGTRFSCRGPMFGSQDPHGSLKPPAPQFQGSITLSGLHRQLHLYVHAHTETHT